MYLAPVVTGLPWQSDVVTVRYDTNISGGTAVICDGRWQTTVVELGRWATDFSGRPLETLWNGRAWLQFCLVFPEGTTASENRWVTGVGAGRRWAPQRHRGRPPDGGRPHVGA